MASDRLCKFYDRQCKRHCILVVLSVFAIVFFAQAAAAGDTYITLISNNNKRGAQIYVPSGYSSRHKYPLIVVLHPSNGTGAGMEKVTNLDPQANRYGYVVAYPDSIGPRWDNQGPADTTFIIALIATLSGKYTLDPRRIYVTGYSDGGGFAQQLVCRLASEFAGLATVGTNMGNDEENLCHPSVPISFLTFHGTADPLVPFDGGPSQAPYSHGETTNSTAQVFHFWAGLDGCGSTQTIKTIKDKLAGGGLTSDLVSSLDGCRSNTSATFYAINGGGHTWPGGTQTPSATLGDVSQDLNASAIILKTLGAHLSSAPNTCFEGAMLACTVPHGSGMQSCVGGQPTKCAVATCSHGYILQGAICAAQ